jgi:Cation transporting ATPase, C-terminus.
VNNQFLKHGLFENKYIILSLIGGIFIQTIVVIVPMFASIFKLVPLDLTQWIITLGISILPIPIMELQKKFDTNKIERVIYIEKENA